MKCPTSSWVSPRNSTRWNRRSRVGGSQVREGVSILGVQAQDGAGAAAYRGPILVGYRLLGFIQEAINLPLEPIAGHATSGEKDIGGAIVTAGKWGSGPSWTV